MHLPGHLRASPGIPRAQDIPSHRPPSEGPPASPAFPQPRVPGQEPILSPGAHSVPPGSHGWHPEQGGGAALALSDVIDAAVDSGWWLAVAPGSPGAAAWGQWESPGCPRGLAALEGGVGAQGSPHPRTVGWPFSFLTRGWGWCDCSVPGGQSPAGG